MSVRKTAGDTLFSLQKTYYFIMAETLQITVDCCIVLCVGDGWLQEQSKNCSESAAKIAEKDFKEALQETTYGVLIAKQGSGGLK